MTEEPVYVWVVSSGGGYYAESMWTTAEAAWAEAERIGVAKEGPGRAVKKWALNAPDQIWVCLDLIDNDG